MWNPFRMHSGKVVSVNVGLPREVHWKTLDVSTGIFKQAVVGTVKVGKLNLEGDRQADLSVHGGPNKAVYGYPYEHYGYWRKELPSMEFPWGVFGENLTTAELTEENLHIGDKLRVGTALLMVTQPRVPCYKLGIRFGHDDMLKRFLASGLSGFYFAVAEEGELAVGSKMEIVHRDPEKVTVGDINRLYSHQSSDADLLRRALRVEALPEGWRDALAKKVKT
jgi:MOSC domain-containing protein YiiM